MSAVSVGSVGRLHPPVLLLLLMMMAALPVFGQPAMLREERMECGLRVVVYQDQHATRVSSQLWYRVGTAQEPPNLEGACRVILTALTETPARNTDTPPAPQPNRHVDTDTGTASEAGTDSYQPAVGWVLRDACGVLEDGPADDWPTLLERQFIRLRSTAAADTLIPADLSRVWADETTRAMDSPAEPHGRAWEQLRAAAFPGGHPYGRPRSADREPPARAELAAFAQDWFVPAHAVLLVIGHTPAPAVLERARHLADGLPWREAPRPGGFDPLPRELVRLEPAPDLADGRPRPAPPDTVEIAWVIPGLGDYSNPGLDVLMHGVCNPNDGPLALARLAAGRPPPRWARYSWKQAGLLVLSLCGASEAASPEAIVAEVLERLAEIETHGFEPVALDRARMQARLDRLHRRAVFADRALLLGEAEAVAGDVFLAELEIPRIRRTRFSDVQDAAARLRTARTIVRPAGAAPVELPPALRRRYDDLRAEVIAGRPLVQSRDGLHGTRVTLSRPGLELAGVRWRWVTASATLGLLPLCGYEALTPPELADLLSYRGLELRLWDDGNTVGLEGVGPQEELALLTDLVSKWPVAATPPAFATWRRTYCEEEQQRAASDWLAEVLTSVPP